MLHHPRRISANGKRLAAEGDYRIYIIVDFFLGWAAGLIIGLTFHGSLPEAFGMIAYYAVELLGFASTAMALAAADLTWGWPEVVSMYHHRLREVLFCIYLFAISLMYVVWSRTIYIGGAFFLLLLSMPAVFGGIRGWPLCFFGSCLWSCSYTNWDSREALATNVLCPVLHPIYLKMAIGMSVCGYLRYLHDQRLVFCICTQPIMAWLVGDAFAWVVVHSEGGPGRMVMFFVWLLAGVMFVYTNLLLRRRRRSLPPGLQKARFVRLGFLREMLRKGEKVRRCQDLPEEAFGDASKAIHFIILSHRWHDPSTCDAATPEFPHGVKLANLVRRLDAHFLPSGAGSLWHRLLGWYRLCCIGGWDVVLFFDFLSIPQNGIAEDGSTVPRTVDDRAVFDECLPNMGTLYSLFPVLALDDVPEGDVDHNYIDSGWCLCEFTIAMLTQQLLPYSGYMLKTFARRSLIDASLQSMDGEAAEKFQHSALGELQSRPFYQESDRKVAAGIIEGFLIKRVLADSIRRGELARVQDLLAQLKRDGLESTLHEPVDGGLNTLLHIAVKSRDVHIVTALLRHGAHPHLRNLRGDTPGQWFLLPRLSAAAATVRAAINKGSRDSKDSACIGAICDAGAAEPADNIPSDAGSPQPEPVLVAVCDGVIERL